MGTDAELVGIEVKGEESQDRGVSGDEFTDEFGGEFFGVISDSCGSVPNSFRCSGVR